MSKLSLLNETYDGLYAQSSIWMRSTDILMNQALLLVALDATDKCDALIEYWKECKKTLGLLSGYSGVLFNTVGIIGMLNGMEPAELALRADLNRKALRENGLTSMWSASSLYATGTALFMALYLDDPSETLLKMQRIMEGWKEDHPWVTGQNDLFYGLLHAMQNSDPAAQVELTEACFQALKRGGYRAWGPWADELQASAQVVSLWPNVNLDTLEERYATITKLLDEKFSFFGPNVRPIAALIAGTDLRIQETIPQLLTMYDLLKGGSRETRLMVALNLMLLERFGNDEMLNARLIAIVVGIVYAQEVATTAAAAAATAT